MDTPRICSIEGCGKPRKPTSKLYCSMHNERKRKGIDMMAPPMLAVPGAPQAFFNSIELGNSDCIIWPYYRNPNGYAEFNPPEPYTSRIVSRNLCIKFHGKPAAEKDEATHSCGNGHLGCVNPSHLVWKSHLGNMRDKFTHETQPHGEECHNSKLTDDFVIEMREMRKLGLTYQAIADMFSVNYRTAYNACTGNTWKHV